MPHPHIALAQFPRKSVAHAEPEDSLDRSVCRAALCVSHRALEDLLYVLHEALRAKVIDLPTFLRCVSDAGRKQFKCRALG